MNSPKAKMFWPIVIWLFLVASCWISPKVWGATVQYPISFGSSDLDSVRIFWWEDWDLSDSMVITSFPITDSLTLDDTKDYKVAYWYWFAGETQGLPSSEFVKFTGGTATVDSTQIARYVWNTPQSGHTVASTFGKYLDVEVSSVAGGTGPYSVTIVTVDTANSDTVPVPYVSVIARNAAQSSTVGNGNTDINGELDLNLTADTHVFIASEVGYTWATYDSHVVAGSQTDTIWGVRWIPTAPTDTFYCRLWNYLLDADGHGLHKAEIIVVPVGDTFNTCNNVIVSSAPITAETNDSGYFQIDVLWSSCRGGGTYNISFKRAKTDVPMRSTKNYTVPDSATHKLVF